MAAASVRGTSHEKTGAPCQDHHECREVVSSCGESVLIAVVSDGAGSASHAEEGSKLACGEIVRIAADFFLSGGSVGGIDDATARGWVSEVREALRARAIVAGLPISAFHCTLLVAVVGPSQALFLQLGDGAIVVADDEGGWCWVQWPQHGEYANTTFFVTEEAAPVRVAVDTRAKTVREVALFSDGIEALVLHYATRTVHAAFFDQMFKPVRALGSPGKDAALSADLHEYLSSRVVCERTDDDKTLLLATLNGPMVEDPGAETPSP